jgi:vacuolar-type H+-ATPase subunit I/STV1
LGIIIGGTMRGLAKLVLGLVMFSGFAILVLMAMQKQDVLTMIASVVFGIIMLVFSFLVKIGKNYPYIKR